MIVAKLHHSVYMWKFLAKLQLMRKWLLQLLNIHEGIKCVFLFFPLRIEFFIIDSTYGTLFKCWCLMNNIITDRDPLSSTVLTSLKTLRIVNLTSLCRSLILDYLKLLANRV